MGHIGLLELKTHEQYLVNLCRALSEAEITLCTTPAIHEEVAADTERDTNCVLKRDDESLGSYLDRVEGASTQFDVLLSFPFSGGNRELLQYALFSPACPTLLWVFNARGWLEAPVLTTAPSPILRRGIKRLIVSQQQGLVFEYPCIEQYVTDNNLTRKQTFTFVPSIYLGSERDETEKSVVVAVPGNVDPQRRNYHEVIDAFCLAVDRGADIRLRILGGPTNEGGQAVIERCRSLVDDGYNIELFDRWVPVEEFQRAVQQSTLIVSPLTREKKVEDTIEHYGRTKGSGNIADAIRNATPILLPSYAHFEKTLGDSGRYYNDTSELSRLLERIANDRNYRRQLVDAAHQNASRYTISRQRDQFESIFEDLV